MSTPVTSPETTPPTTGEVHRALADRPVRRAVWRAVRAIICVMRGVAGQPPSAFDTAQLLLARGPLAPADLTSLADAAVLAECAGVGDGRRSGRGRLFIRRTLLYRVERPTRSHRQLGAFFRPEKQSPFLPW